LLWKRIEFSNSLALTCLILIASILLLRGWYSLKVAPQALNQDESAILLNARFIAESGVDERGEKYPIVFPSFGDAKLPGYIYTTAILWKLFPVDHIVRVPSFLAGIVILVLSGCLVTHLTKKNGAGLATALLLSLSPWSFHFSSIGFEAQLGLALFLGAITLWLRREASALSDFLGAVLFFAACLTYNAPLILAPVVGLGLVFWRGKKKETAPFVVFMLVAFLLSAVATLQASAQKTGIAFFQDANILAEYPAYRASFAGIWQTLLGNQWVYFSQIFVKNIVASFSWEFLVMKGGANPWHGIPKVGHLHFLIPLLAALGVGSYIGWFFNHMQQKKYWNAFLLLVLAGVGLGSLLPAAITSDAPHATRSLFFFVCLTGVAGWQLFTLYDRGCRLIPDRIFAFIRVGVSALLIGGFLMWWYPSAQNWKQFMDHHWYFGLEKTLSSFDHGKYDRVFIEDPEGVLYTRVANFEKVSSEEFMSTFRASAPAQTGLIRGEQLGHYSFVYQPSDADVHGIYLEQKSNKEWGTIEL
jgi:hypothetical protein